MYVSIPNTYKKAILRSQGLVIHLFHYKYNRSPLLSQRLDIQRTAVYLAKPSPAHCDFFENGQSHDPTSGLLNGQWTVSHAWDVVMVSAVG